MSNSTANSHSTSAGLLSGFPVHTREDWRKAAEELLKGRSFEKTLITPTYEGFDLQPIYMEDDLLKLNWRDDLPGLGSMVRGMKPEGYLSGDWKISQEMSASTPDTMNAHIHEGLNGGQDELNLWLDMNGRRGLDPDYDEVQSIGVCGMSLVGVDDLSQVFRDVHLDYISTYWRAGAAPAALAALYFAYAQKAGFRWADLKGCIEADPLHFLVSDEVMPHNLESAFDEMASLLHFVREHSPSMQVIGVQGHAYHNGGASSAQEMGYVLATAVYYLREMVRRGFQASEVVPHMRLCFSIGSQHFVEIAKLRAIRLLWNRILEAFEVAPEDRKLHLHARTGLWNKTVYDPFVNMLRTTNEAFAAIVGGCDSLHVGPFDEIIRETDTFSRRIARNTHAILGGECYLSRVIDPAGGSYAVETLTSQIADKAWLCFQEIEGAGGMVAALKSGIVQNAVEQVRKQKATNIQKRRDSIVGSNIYPLRGEKRLAERRTDYAMVARQQKARVRTLRNQSQQDGELAAVRAAEIPSAGKMTSAIFAAVAGATLGEIHRAYHIRSSESFKVDPVPMRRASYDFEVLRERSQKAEKAGQTPQILQLNLGPSRNYRMRADWTSAFFETGGFDVLNENDFADAAAALDACKSGKALVAVITSDDATYAAQAENLAQSIKAECPQIYLLLAGAPGVNEAGWRAAGVDDFVNVKVNNYAMNKALLDLLKA